MAGQPKTITPEEVGAGILSYLKKVAEEFIGRPVRRAVAPLAESLALPEFYSGSSFKTFKSRNSVQKTNRKPLGRARINLRQS